MVADFLQKSNKKKRRIYLDSAAATPLDRRVFAGMRRYLLGQYENPSALYAGGVSARNAVESARKTVADFLGTQPDTIFFTGGGTEANNLAVLGTAQIFKKKHIMTTAIEHHSVLEPIRKLEREGWRVTYLPVDRDGMVSVQDFKKALRKETVLVSIMYANNEVGSIQHIPEIGREILRWRKNFERHSGFYPLFHVDACQAAAYLPMKVDALHVDLLTFNGSKIYGPKGLGVLYKRRGVEIEPMLYGGGQERGLRSGTENVPAIVGVAKAVEVIGKDREKAYAKIERLKDYFWGEIQKSIKDVKLNGPTIDLSPYQGELEGVLSKLSDGFFGRPPLVGGVTMNRLPNNLNISFTGCDAEALILYLDAKGIACSAGSACAADSPEPSHVLAACGYSDDRVKSSIRFTLGRQTTKRDIDAVMNVLPGMVERVRKMDHITYKYANTERATKQHHRR